MKVRFVNVSMMMLVLMLAVSACDLDQRPEYSIVLLNTGPSEVNDASVKYNGFTSLGGVLMPNAEKGQSGVREPLPSVLTVVWTSADRKQHEQRVQVRGTRPFRELHVTISGDLATAELK